MELILIVAVILAGTVYLLMSPGREKQRREAQRERKEEAQIRFLEARTSQIKDQTQGIVERYRMTRENRINAMIRQSKQELEIEKLKEQIKLLKQSTGNNEPFTPNE